jgi:hypothetical protein
MIAKVLTLDPGEYQCHAIHALERQWAETNCYVDVWIELLHAWGFEPIAALPFTVAIDFEGDQWTFFKFPLSHLDDLFGLDVQELQIWRPLESHLVEQVGLGRPVLVEMDSYFLPDTQGTAYRREHVKSTIAVTDIDATNQRIGYFHGQGYYYLADDDYRQILHLNGIPHPSVLPPYVEIVKRRRLAVPTGDQLTKRSIRLLAEVLSKMPDANPFEKFQRRFSIDLKWLAEAPLETFHQYSFATLRQFGACYELTSTYLGWLKNRGVVGLDSFIESYTALSTSAKSMQFQLARAMARKRPLDLAPIEEMSRLWKSATEGLKSRFSTSD